MTREQFIVKILGHLLMASLLLGAWGWENVSASRGTIPFLRVSLQEGLSQAAVHAIVQDKEGYMWFGTQEGLNRFDGYEFKTFLNEQTDSNSLSHNWVYALLVDRDGVLWVGTNGGGLNRFDFLSGQFKRFQHDPDDPFSLSNDRVRDLYEDSSGNLWVGTDGGV